MNKIFFLALSFLLLFSCKDKKEESSDFQNNCGIKKLKVLIIKKTDSYIDSISYFYNNDCRLIKAMSKYMTFTFDYSDSKIKCTISSSINSAFYSSLISGKYMSSMNLNGRIGSKINLYYNDKGMITNYRDTSTSEVYHIFEISNYRYENENLISCEYLDSMVDIDLLKPILSISNIDYEYTDTLKKGDFYQPDEIYPIRVEYFVGLLGKSNKNLIRRYSKDFGVSINYDITYELDNDGYVSKEIRKKEGKLVEEYEYKYY